MKWIHTNPIWLAVRAGNRRTSDAIFQWLLVLASIGSVIVAAWGAILIGVLVAGPGIPVGQRAATLGLYLGVPIAGALFNIGCRLAFRRPPYGPNASVVVLAGNSLLVCIDYALVLRVYGESLVPLQIPVFLFLAVFAGILVEVRRSVALLTLFAAEYAAIILLARDLGALADTNVVAFLPATVLMFYAFALPAGFISRQLQDGEERLEALNRQLEDAQAALARYVAPQLVAKIREGHAVDVSKHHRQKLTIFFSDIKDFTATTDSMEPEDLARLLDQYIDEMTRIANTHHGTVAQISGDGLFIFFGAPEFVDDRTHALACVRMAVAMQARMRELQPRWFDAGIEHPFRIRCGVNTGMATVGGFGSEERREYTAIGMQTNLAARLEAACEPGQILMSHTTWALVKDEIPSKEMGELEVKGFHRPIRTYQVQLAA